MLSKQNCNTQLHTDQSSVVNLIRNLNKTCVKNVKSSCWAAHHIATEPCAYTQIFLPFEELLTLQVIKTSGTRQCVSLHSNALWLPVCLVDPSPRQDGPIVWQGPTIKHFPQQAILSCYRSAGHGVVVQLQYTYIAASSPAVSLDSENIVSLSLASDKVTNRESESPQLLECRLSTLHRLYCDLGNNSDSCTH